MDIIFNNLDLMKTFTISLIKLDVDKDLIMKLMYHLYNVHQSNKCFITNLLFPKSKETCDEIINEVKGEDDKEVLDFLSKFRYRINNEIFNREIHAVSVATNTFVEINQHCKLLRELEDQRTRGVDLSQDEFDCCQKFMKELILYECMDRTKRDIYFHKKKIKIEFRKNMDKLYEELEMKCSREIYDKITKKKKFQPVLWEIRKNYGDDIIFACGDQRKKMDFILTLLQKIYL